MQYISEETNIQDTKVNDRENRRDNAEWTIQRNCNIEHTRKTQDEDKTNLKKSKGIPIVKKLEF